MNPNNQEIKSKIGITLGDINGIGSEIIIKTLDDIRITDLFTPIIYGSSKIITYYKKLLKYNSFNFQQISSIDKIHKDKINLINLWNETVEITPGRANETGSKYALISLETATQDLLDNKVDALVTAPISKEYMYKVGFKFLGHTEYFANKNPTKDSLMFMIGEKLKIGLVTGHIAIQDVPKKINKEIISKKLEIMLNSLNKDFGIKSPKIAVLGLNPHAGENGELGNQEKTDIIPVIKEFKEKNNLVFGPFPSDSFFRSNLACYDAVLSMYHDQGLIPFKSLEKNGINYTAGNSFIRTSPDHGTAFPIAGKNQADSDSFRNALFLAHEIIKKRQLS